MPFACSICSDLFDQHHSLSAVPCGHVFHSNCINMWLNQSKTCPECREQVSLKNILKLYFNFQSNSILDVTTFENEISNCKAQLSEKSLELDDLRKEKEALRVLVTSTEKKISNFQQLIYKYEADISTLRLKIKSSSNLESKVLKLESRNTALMNDLEFLNNIRTVVNGSQKEIDEILTQYGTGSESVKQLATYCSLLKRELMKVMESKSKIQDLNAKLKKENSRYAVVSKLFEFSKPRVPEKPAAAGSSFEPPVCDTNDTAVKIPSTESDVQISPLTVAFNKTKFNVQIGTKNPSIFRSKKVDTISPFKAKHNVKVGPKTSASIINTFDINNENSVVRTGYNGLGGHSNFIKPSGIMNYYKRKL